MATLFSKEPFAAAFGKNIPCLTIIKPASKNTQASISLHQCTCADLFSVRRIRRRSCTTATGHDIAPCFPLPFLHCSALSAFSPPLCGQISLAIFCKPSLGRILVGIITRWNIWGPVPHFHLDASFCLRGACAGLARKMQLDFSDWGPTELTCSAKTSGKTSHLLCVRKICIQGSSIVMSMYCICCVNGCAEEKKADSKKNFDDKIYIHTRQYMRYI